ncbi:MAG: hypothetical protein A2X86_16145 [Bdellovibrionales bacterium GWA2_49_15]|nr:MAG: hypothetical protein A2X86_16145 [Bdellovibrionales bacterium GWA2_49_15]HAZ13637.1 hypothetical protein [Bdellovibrionales bacterium]
MIEIYKNELGLLCTRKQNAEIILEVRPCFPWSRKHGFYSLRDEKGVELALLSSVETLPQAMREIMVERLEQLGFTLKILQVLKIVEDIELRHFEVRTPCGVRIFQTMLDDWPKKMGQGHFLITDLHGDLYQIADFEEMDKESKRILEPYVA